MRAWLGLFVVVSIGCGDDGGGGGGGTHNDAAIDSPTHGANAVAHAVHGAAVPMNALAAPPVPGAASDGTWYVTPDRAKVTIEMINFEGSPGASAPLSNCVVTFDKTTPSLSNLLDCPFTIPPGTYSGMTVHIAGTFEVLIDDPANGIFTDPAAATKLSATAPSGGAALVSYTRPLGGTGIQQPFPQPLTVAAGDSVSLAIVLDAIQTLHVTVSNGGANLAFKDQNQIPVNIFATLSTPGVARYLTSANTAQSYNDSSVLANIVRVYYAAGSNAQPVYLFDEQTAGAISCATPSPAYPIDPANSTPLNDGSRLGGWLGRDSAMTTCWAVPGMPDFSTYRAYFTLGNTTAVGDTATLACKATTSPTPPTSGMTYASGCPAITPNGTATLTLVAQ